MGIDLGTSNSAVGVMENGAPVIMKSDTQKDITPSIVSVTRKGILHTGDTAANELANQVLRAAKSWDGRTASTDVFKEFKRVLGTKTTFRSKNLKKDFTPEQLSAEIIKTLAAHRHFCSRQVRCHTENFYGESSRACRISVC